MSLIERVFEVTGHRFSNEVLLGEALTHASCADERLRSNERMEFLGDAVLGFVICEHLYETYPTLAEGDLTKIKSVVVSRKACAQVSKEIGLCDLLTLGKGMASRAHGGVPMSVSAAALEAIIAAIYHDGGLEAAREFILTHMTTLAEAVQRSSHQQNFKSVLQQHAQKSGLGHAQYLLMDEKGPDHAKCFEVCVELDGRRFDPAWANAKKDAEQRAALHALVDLGLATIDEEGVAHLTEAGEEVAA